MSNLERQESHRIQQSFFDRHFSWLFPAPSVIIMIVLMAFPVAYTLYLSFTKWSPTSLGTPEDFKTPAFRRMLVNALFWVTKRDPAQMKKS